MSIADNILDCLDNPGNPEHAEMRALPKKARLAIRTLCNINKEHDRELDEQRRHNAELMAQVKAIREERDHYIIAIERLYKEQAESIRMARVAALLEIKKHVTGYYRSRKDSVISALSPEIYLTMKIKDMIEEEYGEL